MLHSKLIKIQNELKAPKNQYNSFGKYKYRSCEDILEAVKPLLNEYQVSLTINDDIVMIGDRFYIKSTITLTDTVDKEIIVTNAFAREEETKKGMDGSQVTGASSSYARKYALNGLFLIDDTKDSDATNKHDKEDKEEPKQELITEEQKETLKSLGTNINGLLQHFKLKSLDDMIKETADKAIEQRKKFIAEAKKAEEDKKVVLL